MPKLHNKAALEALLFMVRQPLSRKKIATLLAIKESEAESLLVELKNDLKDRGIQLVALLGGYILATRPEAKPVLEKLSLEPVEVALSAQAMETLAIVAYRQPVTRQEVEMIRGVDSSGVLDTLILKGFVEDRGRKNVPGRPFVYGTSEAFLRHFGLQDLTDLPPLSENGVHAPIKIEQWFEQRQDAPLNVSL